MACPHCQATLTIPGKAKSQPTGADASSSSRQAAADPLVGATLGGLELLEPLGRGGMGAVYKAREVSLDRLVAVKVLPQKLARDASFIERFTREAKAAAAVSHPHIIEIFHVGQDSGHHYIAMELVDGESLDDVLRREGRLPAERARELLKQVAAALAEAHRCGVLHRDIKPSNILLTARGLAKVADFGLAKRPGADVSVTQSKQTLGTPLYMPPEAARGERLDARSDLYSLGATFYHVLAGIPPFTGESAYAIAVQHAEADVPPLPDAAPDAPPRLCRIIHRLLAKAPTERYQTADELLEALEWLEGGLSVSGTAVPPHKARPSLARRRAARGKPRRRRFALAASAGLAALVLVLFLVLRRSGEQSPAAVRPPPPTSRVPRPTSHAPADPRLERNAEIVLNNIRTCIDKEDWPKAKAHLDRLTTKYGKSRFVAAHGPAIAALHAQITAALKPKPPEPQTPEPGTATPQPPTPEPPTDDDERWTEWRNLFDGSSLKGWAVLRDGVMANHGAVRVQHGQILLARGRPATGISKDLPGANPEYELAFDAMRVEGADAFCLLNFGAGTSRYALILGRQGSAGLELRHMEGQDASRNLCAEPLSFQNARWYAIRLRVTLGDIEVWADGERRLHLSKADHPLTTVEWRERRPGLSGDYAWTGDFNFISWDSSAAIRRIRCRRRRPEPADEALPPLDGAGWTELFDGKTLNGWRAIDRFPGLPKRYSDKGGRVYTDDGWIVLEQGKPCTGIAWAGEFPRIDYEVVYDAMRLAARDAVCAACFPVGASQCSISVGSYRNSLAAIGYVDGHCPHSAHTAKRRSFANGRWYRIRVRVTDSRVQAWVGAEQIADLATAGHTFTTMAHQRALRPFGIASWRAKSALRNIRLRRLTPEQATAQTKETSEGTRQRELDARLAEALRPADARLKAWDFAGAVAELAKIVGGVSVPRELAPRLARRRDEVERLAKLKTTMVERIKRAKPRLQRRSLLIPGINADLVSADEKGITARLPTGKTEVHEWKALSTRSVQRLLQYAVRKENADDQLAAGLLLLERSRHAPRDGIPHAAREDYTAAMKAAEGHFAEAKKLGAQIEPYLDPLAAAAFARAKALLEEGRGVGTPRLQARLAEAKAALDDLEKAYGKSPWFVAHKAELDAAREQVRGGITEPQAEKLYQQAAALFESKDIWDLKPLVEKLQADYAHTRVVADTERKPSFADMVEAVAKLGKFLTVRKDGKGDFKTIQAAIDAAAPNALIEIQDSGPYPENICFEGGKQSVHLRGRRGTCPLLTPRAKKETPAVTVLARDVRIERLVVAPREAGSYVPCVHGRNSSFSLRSVILCNTGAEPTLSLSTHAAATVDQCLVLGRARLANVSRVVMRNAMVLPGRVGCAHSRAEFSNCVLSGVSMGGRLKMRSCTVAGGVGLLEGLGVIIDSIVERTSGVQGGSIVVEWSDVFGQRPYAGAAKRGRNCIGADPQFRDPEHFDYRLKKTSPCRGKASDGGDLGCRYTPEMLELLKLAFELRRKGIIKF